MLEPLSENNLLDYLTAFADRELDSAQTAEMWRFLADSPERIASMRWLETQARLTSAAKRSLQITPPQPLREKITAAVNYTGVLPGVSKSSRPVPPLEWRKIAAYAATIAAVLIGGLTLAVVFSSKTRSSPFLPPTLIADVDRIHSECARLPDALHNAHFEEIDAPLAKSAAKDLAAPSGAPDLSAQGFRLVGAGPCPASELHLVHLLYRSLRPTSTSAVSIFVEHDAGQYPQIRLGKVYRVSNPAAPFTLIAWRSGGDVYFLVADTDQTESDILERVHPTPANEILSVAMQ